MAGKAKRVRHCNLRAGFAGCRSKAALGYNAAMSEDEAAGVASSQPPPVRHRRSLPAYVGSGGIATASHYGVTIASVELFGVAPIVATILGFATGALIKYGLNYTVAFRSRARHGRAAARYVVALFALLALNTLAFALLQGTGMHYLLAQALTTILLIAPGYVIHRQWVFR
jgi:putative flippase GtrA